MKRTTRIAVIGAGLGGMTVAGLLQRAGFSVTIYEQATAFSRIGAGIHLSANVMMVMRRLSIEKALSDIGLHPDAFVSRKADTGEILFELPLDDASNARYGGDYINVHRGDLHAVMETALAPETIRFGLKLADVSTLHDEMNLRFDGGETAAADIIIGADGVNSKVRELLHGKIPARYTGRIAHRAIYPSHLLEGLPIRACSKWWGDSRHILVYYMTQTREEVYLVSSVPEAEWTSTSPFVPCDRASFQEAFAGFHPELRRVVDAAPEVTKWPVFDLPPLPFWSRGRIVLLGDACHAMKPYMAAGAAMAIEDAAVLARCIAGFGDGDPQEAFTVFEKTRGPRVEKVREISEANTWLRDPIDPSWLFTYDACSTPLCA